MRVLICGDRNWGVSDEYEWRVVRDQIVSLKVHHEDDLVIISGGARGADSIAEFYCDQLGIAKEIYPAAWSCLDDSCMSKDEKGRITHRDFHGRAAGAIRNKRMLVEGRPDLVIAFHRNIEASKGTGNMIELARKNGVPYIIWDKELATVKMQVSGAEIDWSKEDG